MSRKKSSIKIEYSLLKRILSARRYRTKENTKFLIIQIKLKKNSMSKCCSRKYNPLFFSLFEIIKNSVQ